MMKETNPAMMANGGEQSQIDVSVIVAFYNAETHIEKCVEALLLQNYPPARYEIILVDNNSTDGSAALVRKYERVRLISQPKQGSYASRNRGVAESRGTILAFTDADCVPSKEWLKEITKPLRSREAALAQGARSYAGSSSVLSLIEAFEAERIDYTLSGKNTGIYFGYTNNMAVRRDVFDRAGPFLEIMRGADTLFVHQVIAKYSSDAICYAADARIRHLEISSVSKWFQKRFIYGRSFQLNWERRKATFKRMTRAELYSIFERTLGRKRYSLQERLYLITFIALGMIVFKFGSLSGRVPLTRVGG